MWLAWNMPRYTRSNRTGGTFFFTVRLADRRTDLLAREVDLLRRVTRQTRDRLPFDIDEIVVLPNVIHTIWTLPDGDADFSTRWRMLKSLFSRGVPTPAATAEMRLRPGEKGDLATPLLGAYDPRYRRFCGSQAYDSQRSSSGWIGQLC